MFFDDGDGATLIRFLLHFGNRKVRWLPIDNCDCEEQCAFRLHVDYSPFFMYHLAMWIDLKLGSVLAVVCSEIIVNFCILSNWKIGERKSRGDDENATESKMVQIDGMLQWIIKQ